MSKKSTVKSVLLDQKWVVGIGNIYASEALHISGISPLRTAKSLSKEECKKLVQACKNILKKAIKAGGTTLKDFKKSDGKPGYFKQQLNVYGRAKAHCMSCQIGIIEMVKVNQRSTFYCPSCQK